MSFRELMHPRQSKFEFMVLHEVNKLGHFPVTDKEFCVLSTWPDQFYHNTKLAVYLDQEKVHFKRQDRDEYLRDLLKKRYRLKDVLAFKYKYPTKTRAREVAVSIDSRIKEALSFES